MEPLIIPQEADTTPAVILDSAKSIFEIKGWSHPEDAMGFYTPVFEWLNKYEKSPNAKTDFHFGFKYYNTASAKQIFRLISLLETIALKSKTTVYWHHDADDDDMLEGGKRLLKMSTLPFIFVAD